MRQDSRRGIGGTTETSQRGERGRGRERSGCWGVNAPPNPCYASGKLFSPNPSPGTMNKCRQKKRRKLHVTLTLCCTGRWGEGNMNKPLWECNPLDPQILSLGTTLDPQGRMASVHDFYRKHRIRENGDGLAAPRSTLSYRSRALPHSTALLFCLVQRENFTEDVIQLLFKIQIYEGLHFRNRESAISVTARILASVVP